MDTNPPSWAARLRDERESRGWSKREAARRLYAAAGIKDGNVASLARQVGWHEGGRHFPAAWAPHYATVFETTVSDLFKGEDEVERRTLLGLMAAVTAASGIARDAEPLRDAFEAAVAADAGERDADTWERVVYDYAHEVGRTSSAVLAPELITDFAELTRLLQAARGHTRSRLVHVAAQMAGITAIVFTGLGQGRAARRWWRTAVRAADQTGAPQAAALIRGRGAIFALYSPASRLETLEVAQEAIAVGRGRPCSGVASGHAARVQTLAELGRHEEAAAALQDLRQVFERLPDSVTDARGSTWGWAEGRLHFVTSFAHTCAGNMEPAMAAQDAALALAPQRSWQFRGQIQMHRAGVLMGAGDVDEGARHMVQVLETLPDEQRQDGLVRGSALTSLQLVPGGLAARPSIRQAREIVVAAGDR